MDGVSDILKQEVAEGQRQWNEMRYAVPVLERILKQLRKHQADEAKDNEASADALVLPIIIIENEIEKLKGK